MTDGSLVSDFEYDDNSNLTKVKLNGTDNETFEYDIRNQLSKYTSIGNGITADYDYDFERKRLSKTVSNVRRDYVYAGNQVINEYLADNLNASYGIGSGEIVKSDFAGEGTRNYFSDALGSITSLADDSSSLISRNDYDSFGEIVASSGISQNAVTYTGQRLDVESGLMALGNGERYYNPSYGRFIQQDSYAGMPDMPQSLNRFAYTYNNPFSYTDPSGNNPQEVGKSLTGSQTLDWYVRFGVSLATQTPTKEKFNQSLELWNEWALGFGDAFNATGKFVADAIHNPSGTAGNMWEGVKSLASDWSEMAQDPLGTVSALKDTFLENPKLVMRHLGQTSGEAVIARGLTPVKTLAKAPIKAGLKKGLQKAKNSKLGQATTQVATHTVSKISSKATTLKTSVVNASSRLNPRNYEVKFNDNVLGTNLGGIEINYKSSKSKLAKSDAKKHMSEWDAENLNKQDNHFYNGKETDILEGGRYTAKYSKVTDVELKVLREKFNNGIRKKFIKQYGNTTEAAKRFSADEVTSMVKKGRLPEGWTVHHKQPLFRGGSNKFSNFRVMKQSTHTKLNKRLHWYDEGKNPYGLN